MKQVGQRKYLTRAILFGVLWVVAGMFQYHTFPGLAVVARLAIGIVTLPLLWLSAHYFATYWRGPSGRGQ